MPAELESCWEIMDCGRGKGGRNVSQLGECIASKEGLGHGCWAIAGTLCGGEVQGTSAQKRGSCVSCSVYHRYSRMTGTGAQRVKRFLPEEEEKYQRLLLNSFEERARNDRDRATR